VVITEASADHDRVRPRLPALGDRVTIDEDGRIAPDPNRVGDLIVPQPTEDVVSSMASQLRPMAIGAPSRLTAVGWRGIPTYVVSTEDPLILPSPQRHWAQTGSSAGHETTRDPARLPAARCRGGWTATCSSPLRCTSPPAPRPAPRPPGRSGDRQPRSVQALARSMLDLGPQPIDGPSALPPAGGALIHDAAMPSSTRPAR
jgi:hypothetical protein